MTAFGQSTANFNDTVCIPRKDVLKVLQKALEANVLTQQRDAYKKDVDSLTVLIGIKQSQIGNLKAEVKDYDKLIVSYKAEIKVLNEQKELFLKEMNFLTKQLKKERRKKKWTTFIGIAGMATLTTLYILK